jgi:catechol 2,3-dioxygenase-like lactoylglutathione lyase family enzyme
MTTMSSIALIVLVWCATALLVRPSALAQAPRSSPDRAALAALVVSVQDADYRGDLVRLRSIAAELLPFTGQPTLGPAARYWRGFAHWRHALNSLNDGAPPESADRDFEAAISEFRAALATDPADIEARIGLAAGLGNRAYFNRRTPERYSSFMTELRPLVQHIREAAPDNPRMMFVVSASLFWAPPEAGGNREQALAMLERGIRLAVSQPASADTLKPDWGEAELHMLLAWFSLNLSPPDPASALGHAEAALTLRPHWRYVRDNLLPQARRRAGGAHLITVAYRVHRMPAMLAFYREAFGVEFREVDTGGGLRSQFGELGGRTLKFVPIRDTVDFVGFPVHQLGVQVADVERVLAAARKHGGRIQDAPREQDGAVHAAIRDPDGNTLEIYGQR